MSVREPTLINLLRFAAHGGPRLSLSSFDNREIAWAIETGLGPLLYSATRDDTESVGSPLWEKVRSADLTARIWNRIQLQALGEILDQCAERIPMVTLLKGASVCTQFYPESHFRLMRDLDILVPEQDVPALESLLYEQGYHQRSDQSPLHYRNHHHTMPFFHTQKGVWVEVHHKLFPPGRRMGRLAVFQSPHLDAHRQASDFLGRKILRLHSELQIIYIACHWAMKLHFSGGLTALLDTVYLLNRTGDSLRWDLILAWVKDSVAASCLYLLLSYLQRWQCVRLPSRVLPDLFRLQSSFGKFNLRVAHFLITRYLVEGNRAHGRLRSRNLDILWKTLLQSRGAFYNLLLLPRNLLLPFPVRKALLE
jgi:hypothetical protein